MGDGKKEIERVGQTLGRQISAAESEFMKSVAFPQLNDTTDDRALEQLYVALWRLCEWEQQRADGLDRKAYYLFGFSGIVATVLAVAGGSNGDVLQGRASLVAVFVILIFLLGVLLSLVTLRVAQYGGFLDEDVFQALGASAKPVGHLPAFQDSDAYRCFLRESSLQRWLVYRWYASENDRKANWLSKAQLTSVIGLISLVVLLVILPLA